LQRQDIFSQKQKKTVSYLLEYALFIEKFFYCEIGKYYSIMPRKSKISQFDVHVIADVICDCVLISDISDIKFYGKGEESLCYMVRKFHL